MALDKDKLISDLTGSDLTDWLQGYADYSDDPAEKEEGKTGIEKSAEAFAAAYDNYAMDAEDVSGDGPLTLNKQGIIDAIKSITLPGTAATAAQKFAQGIVAYWTGGVFAVTSLIEGWSTETAAAVTSVPFLSSLTVELAVIFNDKEDIITHTGKAEKIAEKLDAATKTVIVTCTGTSGGSSVSAPGPIT
jgi:hypothetical protein